MRSTAILKHSAVCRLGQINKLTVTILINTLTVTILTNKLKVTILTNKLTVTILVQLSVCLRPFPFFAIKMEKQILFSYITSEEKIIPNKIELD